MFIGYLRMVLFIPHSRSLKDRRRVLESITQRIRNNFNISVSQKPSETWQRCELFCVCANYSKQYALQAMDRLEDFMRLHNDIQMSEVEKGVY